MNVKKQWNVNCDGQNHLCGGPSEQNLHFELVPFKLKKEYTLTDSVPCKPRPAIK